MRVDSIKKKENDLNNTINLKQSDKRVFKLNYLKIILKNKKDLFFYAILFFLMGLIVFFWFLNLKDNLKNMSKLSEEDLKKYNEIKSSYDSVKKDLDSSLKSISDSLNNLKSNNKTEPENKEEKTIVEEENNESEILNILDNKQKEEILNNLINNKEEQEAVSKEVPLEFSQEELKIRLDLLNK